MPSVASAGAIAVNVAGIDARRAACFRADITGTARREVDTARSAGEEVVNDVAATNAADMMSVVARTGMTKNSAEDALRGCLQKTKN